MDTNKNILIEVRLGADVIIKSKQVRAWFVERLLGNIKTAFGEHGIRYRIENRSAHIFITVTDPGALTILKNIFGISTFSVIEHQCPSTVEDIVRTGLTAYKKDVHGKTFGLKTRRRGKPPFRSRDINIKLGDALRPHSNGVDLDDPQFQLNIDIDDNRTYFYAHKIPGPGGLPLGVSGGAVCLFSGGFDSPVAAWTMLKRGVKMDYVFCNLAGEVYRRNVLRVGKIMAEYWHHGSSATMHILDFEQVVKILREEVDPKVVQVVLKRLFYKVADIAAKKLRQPAIITGEALGQVSSQTLQNFGAIDSATDLPVIRPLVGMDKQEIIDISRKIGTHDLSAHIKEYCQLSLGKAHTKCPLSLAETEEQKVPFELLKDILKNRETVNLRSLTDEDLSPPEIFIDHIPANSVIIDCRSEAQYRQWHHPDAERMDLDQILKDFKAFDPALTYILYCPFGAQSAVAAEELRERGFTAYSFKGGTQAIRKTVA